MNINRSKRIIVYSYACKTRTNIDVYHRLSRLGWDVLVFTKKDQNFKSTKYGLVDIKHAYIIFNHPRLQIPLNFLRNIILLRPKYLILEQDILSLNSLICWFICCITKSNLVIQTYENIKPLSKIKYTNSLLKKLLFITQDLLLRSFNFIPKILLTVSIDSFYLFKNYRYKVKLVPLGVNKNHFFKEDLKRDLVIKKLSKDISKSMLNKIRDKDYLIYTYVGRLVKEKGVHLLLEAFSELKYKKKILLIDSFERKSKYTSYLKKLIDKYSLKKNIIFFKSNHYSINLIYNISDFIVLPSISNYKWKEQYGRVPVEASFCELSPIISDSGHLKDLALSKDIFSLNKNLPSSTEIGINKYTSRMLSTVEMAKNLDLIFNSF